MGRLGHRQYVLLYLGREAKHSHNLRHPGTGYPFSASNLGLVLDLTSVDLPPPLYGHPKELGHPGGLGTRWLENAAGRPDDAHTLVGLDSSRQDAYIDGAERDFDFLFPVCLPRSAILAWLSRVDDPEPDVRAGRARSVSRAAHSAIFNLVTS